MGPPRPTAPTPTAPQPITYAPPQQLQYQAPPQRPQYQAPPQPQYQPPPPPQEPVLYAYPPPASGTPAWLVTIGVFVGLTVAGYAFYALVLNKHGASASSQREEKASDAKGRGGRDLSKNLEAAGIRIIEENRKPTIKLMLVNHSASDMASLTGTVRLTTDAQHEVAVIPFTLASLAAFEAKDISAPLKTKLRAYELPDWQFIKAEVQLKPAAE